MAYLEHTAIMREVSKVVKESSDAIPKKLDGLLHLMDENKSLRVMKILSLDVDRDYFNRFADITVVEIVVPIGTYNDIIYPNRNNLEFTLIKSALNHIGIPPVTVRYKAIMEDTGRPRTRASDTNSVSTEILDLTDFITVTLQITPLSNYILRTAQTGTVLRKCTPEVAIKTLVTQQLQLIKTDRKDMITGIDMVPADNQETQEQILFPHGLDLVSVPKYVQSKGPGVYNSGLSSYIQDNTWYIFPTYNYQRESANNRNLDIVLLPRNKFPGFDRTFRKKGDQLIILATGDAVNINLEKQNKMNQGTGVRFTNAETLLDNKSIERKDNKAIMKRNEMVTEVITSPANDGVNYTPRSTEGITSNPFQEYSRLASLNGGVLAVTWEHSDPDLIFPGMMANITTTGENGRIIKGKGVVLGVHHHTRLVYPGIVESTTMTVSVLKIRFDDSQFI